MKKLAILIRWPIRPNWESVKKNIDHLTLQLKDFNITTVLLTWDSSESRELQKHQRFDHVISLKEPNKEFCIERLTTKCITDLPIPERNFKMFWTQQIWLDYIKRIEGDFDYIITTRPDFYIDLGNLHQWFVGDNDYKLPIPLTEDNGFTDQFGIAIPSIMMAAWDFKDYKTLSRLYAQSINPEDCLHKIMWLNSVIHKSIGADFTLNPLRHLSDKNYPNRFTSTIYCLTVPILHRIFWKERIASVSMSLRRKIASIKKNAP